MDNDCTYHQNGDCLKGLPGTKCDRIGCYAYYPETPDCEYHDEQCADSARCTSTEEWINAAAKAMADRSTITFIEAVLKASPMEVHDLLAAEYRKAMMHALSHQWRDADLESK